MIGLQKMLAVIDPSTHEQPSLTRAIQLAEANQGQVTALLCVYDLSYELNTLLSSDEREALRRAYINGQQKWLLATVEHHTQSTDVSIDLRVVWHKRSYEATIAETQSCHYDVIIKATQEHNTLKAMIFTPSDWHLLRQSKTPLWFVKNEAWPQDGVILGAINVVSEDKAHRDLNHKITQQCLAIAQQSRGVPHFVSAYPGSSLSIAIDIPDFDPQVYDQSVLSHQQRCMQTHAQTTGIATEQCHVKQGLPEDVIPTLAQELEAQLVVIGTVRRQGLSAAFIGNTAEQVIDHLQCDILALPPS